MRSSDRASV